jgi:hypothetical protein
MPTLSAPSFLSSPRSVSSAREGVVRLWRPQTRVLTSASDEGAHCVPSARAHAAPQAREQRGVPRWEWPPMREQSSRSRVPAVVATLATERCDIPRLEVASEHLDSLGYRRVSRFLLGVTSGSPPVANLPFQASSRVAYVLPPSPWQPTLQTSYIPTIR